MYMYLGRAATVRLADVVMIINTENATQEAAQFLSAAQKAGRLTVCASDLPRSAVVVSRRKRDSVYLCSASSETCCKKIIAGR